MQLDRIITPNFQFLFGCRVGYLTTFRPLNQQMIDEFAEGPHTSSGLA